MVQVIGQGRKRPLTTSQKLGRGVSDALNMYLKHKEDEKLKEEENEKFNKENQFAAKYLNLDLSGVSDPKIRQELAKQAYQAKLEPEIQRSIGV